MKQITPSLRESIANAAIQKPKARLLDCGAMLAMAFSLIPTANAQTPPEFCSMIKTRNTVHYTPGIDVHGKKVVSADLNNDFAKSLYPIKIPVQVNLAERFGLDVGNGIQLEPTIAHFQVHEDGRVMYGDKDLTNKAQALCTLPKPTIEIEYNE